jgi:hypothetical protein
MKTASLRIAALATVIISGAAFAGSVQNVRVSVDADDRLVVLYDLNGSDFESIYLSVSEDGGENFIDPLKISGDVGPEIPPGKNKQIMWDILADISSLQSNRFVARVATAPSDQLLASAQPSGTAKKEVKVPPPKVNPPKTPGPGDAPGSVGRGGVFARSLFIPGLGQIHAGKTRGYFYIPLILAGAGGAYYALTQYDDQKKKYNDLQTLYNRPYQTYTERQVYYNSMKKAHDDMAMWQMANLAGIAVSGVIYGWNLLEITWLDLGGPPDHVGLTQVFAINF